RQLEGQAFIGCTSLTRAELSSSLEEMEASVFSDCINITAVTVNDGCAVIGESSFSDCTKLMSIIIPNSVTSLGVSAFNGCTALTSATIGNGVKEIANYCFENCKALETVKMGNKLTKVGYRSFRNCSAMKSITVSNPDVPDAEEQSFNNYSATLYVPASSVASYKAHAIWGKFGNVQPIVENVYLVISQSEAGRVRIPVVKGASYALAIETESGWKINSVTYNAADVTDQVEDGIYTTPSIFETAELRIAYESTTDGIRPMSASNVKVYGHGDDIVVANVEPGDIVYVYATDGKLLHSSAASSASLRISLKSGATYIVKTGGKTLKIAL
ncbi:MAG: leucine-rich repeat domain-containing protein, partial [Prevotella sp.]|nr:leucine-rich repeat domain-containing protein [Prevotella sp.]